MLRNSLLAALGVVMAGCSGGPLGGLIPGTTPEPQTPISGGTPLQNLIQFGTTTLPEPIAPQVSEDLECPLASIVPGGAAVRLQAGQSSEGVRSQISITNVVRECTPGAGGGVTVRVGAEGRAVIGPAGSPGAHFATLRIEVRKGAQVLATRNSRVGANVPAGQGGADWAHVESGIVIPGSAFATGGDIDIFVTLNPGAGQPRARRS